MIFKKQLSFILAGCVSFLAFSCGGGASGSGAPASLSYSGGIDQGPLTKYVASFLADADAEGVNLRPELENPKLQVRIASLKTVGANTIGLCETSNGLRRVTFDTAFWNSANETTRHILAHHELGHCMLYRGHVTRTLTSGNYASIMTPYILSAGVFQNNRQYYLKELYSTATRSSDGTNLAEAEEPGGDWIDLRTQ